jgi:N-sulfoglucosamine sulfohydrolase
MLRMKRQAVFFLGLLCFCGPIVAAAADKAAETPDSRPNILFCLADDWAWPHAGVYGDKVIKTPTIDRLAQDGVLFNNAFVTAPTCTASRGGILTGQAIHRLETGANLWSPLPAKFQTYPDLLENAGYSVGLCRKGWGPGIMDGTGRTRNPAGPDFKNLEQFLQTVPSGKPFCFWFGSFDPHRPYDTDSGVKSGMNPADVVVPPWLPDTLAVRKDILDYYFETQRFDREVGEMLDLLAKKGMLDNTLIVVSGDNGIPFPRGKCTLYDSGTHAPLIVAWKGKVKGGRVVDDFVSLADLAPTFLEVAGQKPLDVMTARSFLDILLSDKSGQVDPQRDKVFTERERHCLCRPDEQSYPARAIRTRDFLYIWNPRPNLWPSGDPEDFADVDGGSPSKVEILQHRNEPAMAPFYQMAFGKRPAEELYDLAKDPHELHNVAGQPEYAAAQEKLRGELHRWMSETGDPRAKGETDQWDAKCPYGGGPKPKKP